MWPYLGEAIKGIYNSTKWEIKNLIRRLKVFYGKKTLQSKQIPCYLQIKTTVTSLVCYGKVHYNNRVYEAVRDVSINLFKNKEIRGNLADSVRADLLDLVYEDYVGRKSLKPRHYL